jgi:membrane associated rhomboid family serine protease
MRLSRRPTLQTLAVILAVFTLQQVVGLVAVAEYYLFVMDPTAATRPWVLVTSVYAHNGLAHLLANVVVLALVGPLVARRTTTPRYHVFFAGAGAIAGLAEVVLGGLVGPPHAVLGASGAILALVGYLLSGNVVSLRLLDRLQLSGRVQLVVLAAVVVVVTLATSGPGTAVIGHATGLTCGLVAGRARLIDAAGAPTPEPV